MTGRPEMRHGPEQAIERGLAALRAGSPAAAAHWFARGWRLAPDDPTSGLLCAAALAREFPHRAEGMLADAVARFPDCGAARLALAAMRYRLGQFADAALHLHTYLAHFAPPPDPDFPRLASAIAVRGNRPGWIGVDGAGTVTYRTVRDAGVTMRLDGVVLTEPSRGQLPPSWLRAEFLAAATSDGALLGSPVQLRTRSAATGVVTADEHGTVQGWAFLAGDPAAAPRLHLRAGARSIRITPLPAAAGLPCMPPGAPRSAWHFQVPGAILPPSALLRVTGPDGQDLLGSPLPVLAGSAAGMGPGPSRTPAAQRRATRHVAQPRPVSSLPPLLGELPPSPHAAVQPRPADVIIPVFRSAQTLAACLDALMPTLLAHSRVTIVDDGSRDAALQEFLAGLDHPSITILRHGVNRGFPAAANTGLRHAASAPDGPRDAVLLNDDALVPANWLQRLAQSAYSRADIGSVTPATNDGTITAIRAPATSTGARTAVDEACARANAGRLTEIPAGTGFCLYMRHDCLAQTGLLREDVFGQGYGEETDWSLRARHLGWRHAADMAVFVAHRGGATFGAAGASLRARNAILLDRLHPGAHAALASTLMADPLRAARRRIDAARWQDARSKSGAVILITHAQGGGVARHVETRAAFLRAQGLRPILVKPVADWADTPPALRRCVVTDDSGDFHHLIFDPAHELDRLAGLLGPDQPHAVELHHILGHAPSITRLAARLGVPIDLVLHDYALICPRVTLTGAGGRYCGEPAESTACDACVATHGDRLKLGFSPGALRSWTAALVAGARRIVAPDADVAKRFARYADWGGKLHIQPWEDDASLPRLASVRALRPGQNLRVCIPGAIGDEKGYAVLLACARDAAARRLPLQFSIAGHTRDDATLMETEHVFVTGRYAEDDALSVIAGQDPDIGFVPSIWPETWCYSLTLLWRAGLWPVAFAIGTQAARISARGTGTLLPLGLPAPRINDRLLALAARGRNDCHGRAVA
jgi:GT2 family glycosyltransferase